MNELRGFSAIKGDRDLKQITKTSGWFNHYIDGSREVDIGMGGSAFTLGFDNKEVVSGIEEKMLNVSRCQSNNGNFTEETVEAGKFLCGNVWDTFAWAISGTSAVEAAISMNDEYWKALGQHKPKIISFSFAWHGTSYLTKDMGAPFLLGNHTNRCINIDHPLCLHDEMKVIEEIRSLDLSEVGCIVFDSATWINGLYGWSEWWNIKIREICDDYGILMITDDVASGWGKSCSYHPYQTFGYGIQPDISALGKSLTAGYAPMGAAVCNKKVGDVLRERKAWNYNHTWQPSMMGIYLMLNVKEYIEKYDLMQNSLWVHNKLKQFGERLDEQGYIDSYRANGLFMAIDVKEEVPYVSGLSHSQGNSKKLRICAPLIADEQYFKDLEEHFYGIFK